MKIVDPYIVQDPKPGKWYDQLGYKNLIQILKMATHIDHIEIITLKNGDILVINREGKRLNLNYNSEATRIYQEQGGMRDMDIVGMAVLVKKAY